MLFVSVLSQCCPTVDFATFYIPRPLHQQDTKKMEKSPKPNISPLEIEVENKITTAYLFSIGARCGGLISEELFPEHFKSIPESPNNQFTTNQTHAR
jgi:hypothetical protein